MTDLLTLKQLFLENKIHLVDIREKDEWDSCHIEGALHIPLTTLTHIDTFHVIPKDLPIYLYCSTGRRATVAKQLLSPFIDNIHIAGSGGLDELKSCGFPASSAGERI